MLSGTAAKCIFTFPELHFLNFLKYYSLVVSKQANVSWHGGPPLEAPRWNYDTCPRSNSFNLLLSSKYISFQSQLITETVASGGDRFGKLFELMDQVCHLTIGPIRIFSFLDRGGQTVVRESGFLPIKCRSKIVCPVTGLQSDNKLSIS